MINLIFIDIDGVLNSPHFYNITSYYTWDLFDPYCIKLLNKLLKENNAKLVISSDWRKTYGLKKVKEVFKKNKIKSNSIDCISTKYSKEVGIKKYLERTLNTLKNINYVVLDDEELNIDNLVQVNPKYGLTVIDYLKVNEILKK